MENLDVKKTIFYFIKKSWIIIIIALLTLTFGYFYYNTKNNSGDTYVYNANLYINSPSNSSFLACSNIATSDKVLLEVINELNLNITTKALAKKISLNSTVDSKIINIKISDTSDEGAKNIANCFLKYFSINIEEFITSISNNTTNNTITDNLIILLNDFGEPTLVNQKFNLNNVIKLLSSGIIIGISVVFVLCYFDKTVNDIELIESNFDIPVLGKLYKNDKSPNNIDIIKSNIKKKIKNNKTLLLISSTTKENIEELGNKLTTSFVSENQKVLLVNLNSQINENNKLTITKTDIDNFFILNENPSNINSTWLEKLEKDFDQIIITCSPINPNSSSILLTTFIDAVILSVKMNCTKLTDIQNTIKNLNLVDTKISGIIVNNVNN